MLTNESQKSAPGRIRKLYHDRAENPVSSDQAIRVLRRRLCALAEYMKAAASQGSAIDQSYTFQNGPYGDGLSP